jgi:transketolase
LVGLRAIPGLVTIRPADANEVKEAWQFAIESQRPTALSLSRQPLPTLDRKTFSPASGLRRGGYILADDEKRAPDLILISTGSEVALCLAARDELKKQGMRARVVSMPSWELFEEQDKAYRDEVLPPRVRARVSVEAASPMGWDRYVGSDGARIAMMGFGASGPYKEVYKHFHFTPEHIVDVAKEQIARNKGG